MSPTAKIVPRLWSYCNVLRDYLHDSRLRVRTTWAVHRPLFDPGKDDLHADMGLHPKIPLLVLLRLMHLRIPLLAPILCRTGAWMMVASTIVPRLTLKSPSAVV